jgi:hypothetical protein
MSTKKATTEKAAAAKPVKVNVPNVYGFIIYGGQVMKSGVGIIKVTDEHPEVEFNNYKKAYGDEIKGRWVRCTRPIDTVRALVMEKIAEKQIAENIYKIDTTESVKILKEATEATKCTTMGVYTKKTVGEDDAEEEDAEEEEEEEAPKKSAKATKTAPKKSAKAAEPESESEEEEEAPKAKKAAASKPAKKESSKVEIESESEEEVVVKKGTKAKETKPTKKTSKVEEEEELEDIPVVKKKATKVAKNDD